MDENDKKLVQKMIDVSVGKAVDFPVRKRGDTPTDTNQLVPLKYLNDHYFGGRVNADGTAASLPTGWTSSRTGNGQYTVTHSLGTALYGVAITSVDANLSTANLAAAPGANSFSLITWDNGATNTDHVFTFVLILTP